MSRKRIILWAVALLVAYGVGFAIGVALWEEDIAPPGRNQPGPRLTRRAQLHALFHAPPVIEPF